MKKTLLLIFALFMGTNMAFAQKSVAEKAAGTYSGLLYIGMGSPVTDETESSEANIRLEKETDTTVKFVLPNFKYGSMSLGDIVLTNIPVYEKADGTIAFGENNPQTLSLVGGMVSANVNIDHSTSTINGAYASVDVYVTTRILFSDVSIYVRFQGNNGDYEPEGIAHEMACTRTGTAYSQYDGTVTSTSPTSSASAVITATNAQTISLTLTGVEAQGVEIGDIVFSEVTVTDKGDGTATIGDATATGTIMGAMDYTMTLNGAKSYWSTDSMALDITA
ncbi:MAG: calycin-like domain-containing protein, partial [Bacteroidaceae bacterium]|nr:calycin-like domain-containing protein [Bacteroidaceae bacterium]